MNEASQWDTLTTNSASGGAPIVAVIHLRPWKVMHGIDLEYLEDTEDYGDRVTWYTGHNGERDTGKTTGADDWGLRARRHRGRFAQVNSWGETQTREIPEAENTTNWGDKDASHMRGKYRPRICDMLETQGDTNLEETAET